nr:hypothetical protein [Tanacetum cinerariifolium]
APNLPPPSIPIISQVQQAPAHSPVTAPSTSLQDLLNFGSLFGFDHRLKTLETNFFEFMQTNQFSKAVSYIPELKLKKILIEKMQSNKSIHRLDQRKNLYKALVDAYECDKIILETYRDTVILKKSQDDEDKDEEPSPGSDRGKYALAEEPMQTTQDLEEPAHLEFETGATDDQPVVEASQHPGSFSQQAKPPTPGRVWNTTLPATHGHTLTPEMLVGLTYELMKGSCKGLVELEFFLEEESARDVYSKRRIAAVTELQIVKWHNYKHLAWIIVRRDDDKLYKFKEGDLKRLRIQDIEDMLLLLVQGKLTNLTVEERFAFNVSLRMFKRSIVIQRRVEDLQLGFESYQKKLNLTKPDTYRSDLKRKEAYTAYSNPRGFIYQNKDKQNMFMCIDELHKFSNDMLNDFELL